MRRMAWLMMLVGCTAFVYRPTESDMVYIHKIQNQPNEFGYLKTQDALYWGRAGSFVAQYSSMKIQTANDFIIETYNPSGSLGGMFDFGWRIIKTPINNDSNKIQISEISSVESPTMRERICAWYILTGELPPNTQMIFKYMTPIKIDSTSAPTIPKSHRKL
jgi:hypothetical protein